jgi:hypothetical protein
MAKNRNANPAAGQNNQQYKTEFAQETVTTRKTQQAGQAGAAGQQGANKQ